ncbi:MAG: hypothetical protein COB02_17710 [Candidatus Cloacimonadota bacterium]|nr:MAG: hypothetical protein COB02_17710 [Candidatus Cloacimonadota bacterium]
MKKLAISAILLSMGFGAFTQIEAVEVYTRPSIAPVSEAEKVDESATLKSDTNIKVDEEVLLKEGIVGEIVKSSYYSDYDLRYWTVDQAIQRANRESSHSEHNGLLIRYMELRSYGLTVRQVVRIAEACTKHSAHNRVLQEFVKNSGNYMTTRDIIYISQSATAHDTHNGLLKSFVRTQSYRITVREVIRLSEATSKYSVQDEILVLFTRKQVQRITKYDARRLAQATHSYDAHDRILDIYRRNHYDYFSRKELIDLSDLAKGDELKKQFKKMILDIQ